ncbi:uncharacterized protein LOC134705384 [Mytilus trossulus]|uniref:uncharacterized protein LOC134705384 n=1 Tax=Mytilus trossulus TaxID=6551 RepID=UPI003003BAD5
MKGLHTLLVLLSVWKSTFSQQTTRYRNPWVELVRQIACRSVTCNFEETCDLQVVCTPFGDCGQRATCLQIPFPRNRVCPDPFTNAGPPYTVECFDDGGCREPMVCCHSYAKSYCHMPPFSGAGGNVNPPVTPVVVQPVTESALMNNGASRASGNTNNAAGVDGNTNGNPVGNNGDVDTRTANRGGRSVVVARSDFFDPQGFRRQQRVSWRDSLERRRRQQLNSLSASIRLNGDRRSDNEVVRLPVESEDRSRLPIRRAGEPEDRSITSIRRNLNGGRLTVEISGQPGSRAPVVDLNGVRIAGNNGRPIQDGANGNDVRMDENGGGRRNGPMSDEPRQDILRNDGRPGAPANGPGAPGGSGNGNPSVAPDTTGNDGRRNQGAQSSQSSRGQNDRDRPRSLIGTDDSFVRVNLHGGPTEARPFIRKVDLFNGHGFYGARRRILGDIQLDGLPGLPGLPNRFP